MSTTSRERGFERRLLSSCTGVFLFFPCPSSRAFTSFFSSFNLPLKAFKNVVFPDPDGPGSTAIVQVAPRRLFDRESSWSSSSTTTHHHHHHRLWKNNNRTTTTFVCSRCFSSRRSRARPTTPRARKTERGGCIAMISCRAFCG